MLDYEGHHVPDPDLLRYPHVAVPLADIVPYYVHPETGATLAEIVAEMARGKMMRYHDLDLQDEPL